MCVLNKSLLEKFSLLFCLLAQCSCRTQVQWKSCSICVSQILLLHTYAASEGLSMGSAVKNLEIMIRFVYLVVVVVVDLASRSGFRFLFLGCIFVIWHSQIQVMEFASSFFFLINFWICVLGSKFVFLLFLFKTHFRS